MRDYAPVYKAERQKVKLNTRRRMHAHKLARQAEREAERRAEQALAVVPRKWLKHTREMEAMTSGIQ